VVDGSFWWFPLRVLKFSPGYVKGVGYVTLEAGCGKLVLEEELLPECAASLDFYSFAYIA